MAILRIISIFVLFGMLFVAVSCENSNQVLQGKKNIKRGVFGGLGYDTANFPAFSSLPTSLQSYNYPWSSSIENSFTIPTNTLSNVGPWTGVSSQKHIPYTSPVSASEVAAAVQAAKEASSNVIAAQQHVYAAKEAVLEQQRLASAREAAAMAAQRRSEAAAHAQRAEASAAATAVVLAQQRLGDAKAQVAHQQRIAATKEAQAAALIHKSANAAAAEIHRSDAEAEKLAVLQRSGAAVAQHVAATKDANLAATTAAVASPSGHPVLSSVQFSTVPYTTRADVIPVQYGHAPWG